MSNLLIQNGRIVDPASGLDSHQSLLIREGRIAATGESADAALDAETQVLNAKNLVISPGLIDIHVHFREPGQSAKETIGTGSKAAAQGGFTTVVCMPNTTPAIDNPGTVALIQDKVEKDALIHVHTTGAITRDIAGESLAPIGSLHEAGVLSLIHI